MLFCLLYLLSRLESEAKREPSRKYYHNFLYLLMIFVLFRKPFLLQMFGSVANYLENSVSTYNDPFKIQPAALYKLVLSLEQNTPDIINVLELVKMKKPLVSLDFCYTEEGEQISVQDCVAICAMVAAYDSGTPRAHQMLTILDAVLPLYLKQLVSDKRTDVKELREKIQGLSHVLKTVIHNSDKLTQ